MKTLSAYTGNASFARRNAAFQAEDGQRFFVRPDGWADIRVASLQGLAKLLPDGEYRPGGSASSKLQVRWTESNITALGYEYTPVLAVAKKGGIDPTEFMLLAASK